jgi:GNAT superfamily N-acetyltransferase
VTKDQEPTLKQPAACSNRELAEFERLVCRGAEVTAEGLRDRIRAAQQLAFIPGQAGTFVAVGALKRPAPTYCSTVFAKAHSSENPSGFTLELGWIYVEPDHRGKGFSNTLVETLLNAAGRSWVYATSRSNNVAMHSALRKHGFTQSGSAYESDEDNDELFLFVRQT